MAGQAQLYGAAVRQGDPDWLQWVNTCFDVAMYGHEDGIYDAAYLEFFGEKRAPRVTGFPPM
jgi:polar amino acid transport system substrate-binding protein